MTTETKMYCRQCEQTAGGEACTSMGVCGKTPEVSGLQDLLIYTLRGIAYCVNKTGKRTPEVDKFVREALFATVTNVDFDDKDVIKFIKKGCELRDSLKGSCDGDCAKTSPESATFKLADTEEEMLVQAKKASLFDTSVNEDIRSLQHILLYGMKGVAAYAEHAGIMGRTSDEVDNFFYKALDVLNKTDSTTDELLDLVLECGKVNFTVMGLLDEAHTTNFGHPEPTQVSLGAKKGKAILVSGHDIPDLKMLLEQTEGKGINIYTHGEMLPLHAYPEIKKHKHLVGHYGTAWQNQHKEFAAFPGSILMTTNCIQKPAESYMSNIYTTGLVQYPGVEHIDPKDGKKDFSNVINKALELPGFAEDVEGKTITVGFGHKAVLSIAGKIVEAVKAGKIKHFFLVGGCDGAKPGRNYYTEFVEKAPKDTVILTLACGKFRFNTMDLGDIDGIPRLLDIGQCNDAYSAIKIAVALAEAFKCDINELPLSMIISWYEQKAVCILLTLLHLGIKNIKLGPTLPAFISPNVLQILVDKFNIAPITTAEKDLAEILGAKTK